MGIQSKRWQQVLVAACLTVTSVALRARAEDAKPAETTTPPPTARGDGARPDPAQLLKMQRERLDQLNLTDEQKKKLDEIFTAAGDDLKKADAGDRQAMGQALRDVREKVAGVLTDEQKAKMAQTRTAGAGAGGGPMRANLGDRFQAALDKAELSADQKEKVKPIVENVRKKFEELRGQIQGGDRAAMREKFTALMDDTRDKLKEILTPEQAEKVKAALQEGRPTAAGRPGAEKPAEKPADAK